MTNNHQQHFDFTWDVLIPITFNFISLCLGIVFGYLFLFLNKKLNLLPKQPSSGPEEITMMIKVFVTSGFIGIGLCCFYFGYYFGWISVVSIVVVDCLIFGIVKWAKTN